MTAMPTTLSEAAASAPRSIAFLSKSIAMDFLLPAYQAQFPGSRLRLGAELQASGRRFENDANTQVLGGYDASFAVGLFEAMVQVQTLNTPVLLVVIDSEYTQPLHAKRPIADTSGLALVLSPTKSERSLAQLVLDAKAYLADGNAVVQLQPGLEGLSAMSEQLPPWRGVPLLAALADATESTVAVRLPWLPGQVLQLTVQKDQIHAQ